MLTSVVDKNRDGRFNNCHSNQTPEYGCKGNKKRNKKKIIKKSGLMYGDEKLNLMVSLESGIWMKMLIQILPVWFELASWLQPGVTPDDKMPSQL